MSQTISTTGSLHTTLPAYAPLAEFLFDSGAYLEACELHGMLCGFICSGLIAPNAVWMNLLLLSTHEERRREVELCVDNLFKIILHQLSSFSFDFEILLPEAEPEQSLLLISKLSQWSENFLLGLGLAEGKNKPKSTQDNNKSKELTEAKNDIQQISKVYHQVLQCDEPFDEEAFTSLLEHVRVSVMLIFTELNGRVRPTLN